MVTNSKPNEMENGLTVRSAESSFGSASGEGAILAIDPGPTHSAYCVFNGCTVTTSDIIENSVMELLLRGAPISNTAIEMVSSYGMAVGAEVFETVYWIGRFAASWDIERENKMVRIFRKDIKVHLCQSMRAKDANIRQALIDKFNPRGGGKVELQPRAETRRALALRDEASPARRPGQTDL